jgi:hypothetical protein
MEKEFVTHEQALALKELGFDEKCFETDYYHPNEYITVHFPHHLDFKIPLKQQVFRWFREKKCISQILYDNFYNSYAYQIDGKNHIYDERFITYEEAENACIDKLIKLAKEQVS